MSSKALRHIEINNPHAEVRACGYLARLVGPLCPRLLDGLAFERAFAHAHDAVDLASFLNEQAFRRDIAVYDAGGLDLDALVSADTAAHFPPDDRLARDYVSFHLAALPHQHLPAGAHRAHHGAFDFHDTVRADVPYDAHAGPDDGQSVRRVGAGRLDHTATSCAHRCAGGHGDVDAGMRFGDIARPDLTPGDEARDVERPVRRLRRTRLVAQRRRRRTGAYRDRTHEVPGRGRPPFPRRPHAQHRAQLLIVGLGSVQRRSELLHPTVLLLEPRHLALQPGHAEGCATDRPGGGREAHDQP